MTDSGKMDSKIENFLLNHGWLEGPLSIRFWGRGERNESYLVSTLRNKYVFRISREGRGGEDAAYEVRVLKALETTGLSPKPYKILERSPDWPGPVVLMTWAPGEVLSYARDYARIPGLMAKVHALSPPPFLRVWKNPVEPLIQEALENLNSYPQSPRVRERERLMRQVDALKPLALSWTKWFGEENRVFTNTQAGASNFLVTGDRIFWLDWDQAACASRWVDLAHFANPAATWWEGRFLFNTTQRKELAELYKKEAGLPLPVSDILERMTWMGRALEVRTLARVWRMAYEAQQGRTLPNPALATRCKVLLDSLEDLLH